MQYDPDLKRFGPVYVLCGLKNLLVSNHIANVDETTGGLFVLVNIALKELKCHSKIWESLGDVSIFKCLENQLVEKIKNDTSVVKNI